MMQFSKGFAACQVNYLNTVWLFKAVDHKRFQNLQKKRPPKKSTNNVSHNAEV